MEKKTKVTKEIDARLEDLDPSTTRYQILVTTRTFKSSWTELGKALNQVFEQKLHAGWGYETFEDYCRRELHIKKDTAYKLIRSFVFMQKERPQLLHEQPIRELPTYDVVDLLAQAREKTRLNDSDFERIQESIFSADVPPTKSSVLQQFREHDPLAFRKLPKNHDTSDDMRKALLLAERLQVLLHSCQDVSADLKTHMDDIVSELQTMLGHRRRKVA